jgi:hypothetical protein
MTCGRIPQTATFTDGGDAGDRNRTGLTAAQILTLTGGCLLTAAR